MVIGGEGTLLFLSHRAELVSCARFHVVREAMVIRIVKFFLMPRQDERPPLVGPSSNKQTPSPRHPIVMPSHPIDDYIFYLEVFVFGPDNLIWELDKASATAENVLGRAHAGLRLIDGGASGTIGSTLVNGKAVPMHYAFKNGDVLDVDLDLAMG